MKQHALRPRWRMLPSAERIVGTAALAIAVAALSGCGSGASRPERYPVAGTVTYNGEPLTRGIVSFHPQDKTGRPAFAELDRDGTFQLSTFENNDGAAPGKYKVTIQVPESPGPLIPESGPDEAAVETVIKEAPGDTPNTESGEPAPPDGADAASEAKSPIPVKYTDRDTTPLEFEVKSGPNNVVLPLSDE